MTWQETHARWRAVREVEAAIDATAAVELPWNERLEEVFGDRAGLLRALEYRWNLVAQAQLDPELPDAALRDTLRRISSRHSGLLRILERYRWDASVNDSTIYEEGNDIVHV